MRETAKAFGLSESEIDRMTRLLPLYWRGEKSSITQLLEEEVAAETEGVWRNHKSAPAADEKTWRKIAECAERIVGFPRHLSIHCAGVVIAPEALSRYTPVQRAAKGSVITQMEMHAIETLGLLKIDILSNRSLGVFTDCLQTLGLEQPAERTMEIKAGG